MHNTLEFPRHKDQVSDVWVTSILPLPITLTLTK